MLNIYTFFTAAIKKHPALKPFFYFGNKWLSVISALVAWCVVFSSLSYAANTLKPQTKTIEAVTACLMPQKSTELLEKQLQWIKTKNRICGGYYAKQTALSDISGLQLSADQMNLAFSGWSTIKGNVVINQKNKSLAADVAKIYRENGQISKVELLGNIEFNEPNYRVLATKGQFNLQSYSGSLSNVLYRLFIPSDSEEQQSSKQSLVAWGQACQVKRQTSGNLALKEVSYSTCPPAQKTWYLKAKQLKFLKKSAKGIAKQATFYFKNKPYLYVPYISFPLDNKRKSGFLPSTLSYSTQHGLSYLLPYYMNIAPNFDATLFPQYFNRRGFMIGGEARYLFGGSQGLSEAHFLAKDKAFQEFKQANLWLAPQLANLSDKRYSMKWLHQTRFNEQFDLKVDFEKVSDDYYLQDFSNNLVQVSENQLLQGLSVNFKTAHWVFKALVQQYQTLHPFNQSVVNDVYARLPSISAFGDYQKLAYDFFVNAYAQVDHFVWRASNNGTIPQGERYHFAPTIGINKENTAFFTRPQLTLYSSYYDLESYNRSSKSITRVIPVASFDQGFTFERYFAKHWRQTLEPRIYYLYAPYVEQSTVPVFDTSYFFQTYNQLFRNNRFVGLDRVGDANQLSLGLSSRFIDDNTGQEWLRLSLGSAYRFQKERVLLCQNLQGTPCQDNPQQIGYLEPHKGLAPIQLETEIKLPHKWTMFSNIAFGLDNKRLNNSLINFHYEPQLNHIVNLGYGFLLNGDPIKLTNRASQNTNLHQFRISYAWPYNDHWRSLGAMSYNISHQFSMSYLLGLQYDDCCVAFRLIGGRVYRFYNPLGSPRYGNNVYVQLLLKGLGSASNNDPYGVIKNFLPTFRDEFK